MGLTSYVSLKSGKCGFCKDEQSAENLNIRRAVVIFLYVKISIINNMLCVLYECVYIL